jgi:hypothetical protein
MSKAVRRASCVGAFLAVSQLGVSAPASAQTMRTFTVSRPAENLSELAVRVEFGAGHLLLTPAAAGTLYSATIRYDQDRATPVHRYEATARELELRLRPIGTPGVRVVNREQLAQQANVTLTGRIPLDLDVTIGAGEGEIELGGLQIRRGAIHSLATRAIIRASRPNRIACETLDLDGGAAEVFTEDLGNLRCAEIRFEGGVGRTTLDLTGSWNSTLRVRVKQALGELRLVLPKDAGVRIVLDRMLTRFNPEGFTQDGTTWVTAGYRDAPRTIQLDVTSAAGGIEVVWE